MQRQTREFLKSKLPGPVLGALRATRRLARSISAGEAGHAAAAHGVKLGAPVAQLYIDEHGIETSLGVNNFYSMLLPELDQTAAAELSLYDPQGRLVAQLTRDLAHFAAGSIEVSSLFRAAGIKSPYGIVAARLIPRAPERREYEAIGEARCFFFVFYRDQAGSIGQVPPNAVLRERAGIPKAFESNQVIVTHGLRELALYQFNPGAEPATFTHALKDLATGGVVAQKTSQVAAFGSQRVSFPMAELEAPLPARLGLTIDGLYGSAKPILRRIFADGSSSFSHC
jgi:hypothetical protein